MALPLLVVPLGDEGDIIFTAKNLGLTVFRLTMVLFFGWAIQVRDDLMLGQYYFARTIKVLGMYQVPRGMLHGWYQGRYGLYCSVL